MSSTFARRSGEGALHQLEALQPSLAPVECLRHLDVVDDDVLCHDGQQCRRVAGIEGFDRLADERSAAFACADSDCELIVASCRSCA
jgi:hypothetical protein